MNLDTARRTLSEIVIEYASLESFIKDRKTEITDEEFADTEYISMQDLQESFGISRYQLIKYLKQIDAKPIGEKKNYKNGKRTRGVGKVVYAHSVLDDVEKLLVTQVDIAAIKSMARKILGD